MGRDGNRRGRMSTLSWVIFRSKTHFFRNFFEVNFKDDFLMNFYRCLIDLGRVLGGQNCRKIEIFHVFGDAVLHTSILMDFSLIFTKIYIEKHNFFLMFF